MKAKDIPLWVDGDVYDEHLAFYPATFDYAIDPEKLEGDVVGPMPEPPRV